MATPALIVFAGAAADQLSSAMSTEAELIATLDESAAQPSSR
jgi:hypothetical protein